MKETYRVEGMTCGGCSASVTRAIQSAAPGAEVSVNLESKTIEVSGVDDEGVIAQAVDDAGFDFKGKV